MMAQIEKVLTRIPLYVLVGGSLALLTISALVYATFGLTNFTPLDLAATTLVFGITTVVVSYALGRFYGIYAHLQSSLITALILTLLFTPTLDGFTLLQYAIIATIAAASKFVIAPFGRHLFNPAAFGAFMGGILGLSFASWWIASPTFIALVVLTSFAVLYKTRQLALGGVFIGLAASILIVSGLMRGEPVLQVAWTVFASWPLIFLAGFMLSEPLTLPPRKRQRLVLAVLVACIVALPFHIGDFFNSSPAFALLVGNIFAFAVAWHQRKGVQLTLTARHRLTATADEYVFSSSRPLSFLPGQYIELSLPHAMADIRGTRRTFSITSQPGEEELRLGIRFRKSGSTFKQALRELPLKSVIQTTGINGDFTLPSRSNSKLLFIASGIGITPFISHIQSLSDPSRVTLLYFNRKPGDIPYQTLLDTSGVKVHYFTDTPLTQEILSKHTKNLSSYEVFISGPPATVATAKQLIGKQAKSVHTDYFSGY